MSFKDKVANLSKTVDAYIEGVEMDVKIKKLSIKEAKYFEKLIKRLGINAKGDGDIPKLVHEVLSRYITDSHDEPLIEEDDKETAENMPIDVAKEILGKFREVNGNDEDAEEIAKK